MKSWLLGVFAVVAFVAGAAASARQADQASTPSFTGKWVAEVVVNGSPRDTTYFLTQKGTTLTGTILTGYRMQDISDGTVSGNQATWDVVMGTGDQQRKIQYTATIDG